MQENIFPIKHTLLQQSDKEKLNGHKGIVLWMFGLSGSGKTTIGKKIKEELKFRFFEGDNFHSKYIINKMKKGISLSRRDRLPWLLRINKKLKKSG